MRIIDTICFIISISASFITGWHACLYKYTKIRNKVIMDKDCKENRN